KDVMILFRRSLIAIALLSLMWSATLGAGLGDYSISREAQSFKDQEDVKRFSKELSDTAERITVKVKLKVKQGAVRIRLEDPHGTAMWDQRVEAEAEIERKEWFNAKRGEWRLLLIFEGATGRYSVKLSSR
ncbi:MAG: hypothetical protein V3T72_07025, partial [Thermoanaerobaculia bacterium]